MALQFVNLTLKIITFNYSTCYHDEPMRPGTHGNLTVYKNI